MAYQVHTVELIPSTVPSYYDRVRLGFRANIPIPGPVNKITDVQVTNNGSNYTAVPAVNAVYGASGSGAILAAVLALDTVTNVTSGTGYATGDLLTLSGGTGTAPVIQVSGVKLLSTSAMTTSGAGGYAVGDQITLGGGGSQATTPPVINVATTTGAGVPNTYSIATAGVFQTSAATLSQIGTTGSGTGVTVTATYGAVSGLISVAGLLTALPTLTYQVPVASSTGAGTGSVWSTTYNFAEVNITSGGASVSPDVSVSIGAPNSGGIQATALATTYVTNSVAIVPVSFGGLPVSGNYVVQVTGSDTNTIFAVESKTIDGFQVVATPKDSVSAVGGTFDVTVLC